MGHSQKVGLAGKVCVFYQEGVTGQGKYGCGGQTGHSRGGPIIDRLSLLLVLPLILRCLVVLAVTLCKIQSN